MSAQTVLFEEEPGSERQPRRAFDLERFVESFPVLVEAEGGPDLLREFVLSLALRGNLSGAVTPEGSALPTGWTTAPLREIASLITKGTTPTTLGFPYEQQGIRFVKVENVKRGSIHHESITEFISDVAHETLSRSQLAEGDVLFSIAGTIGRTCVVQRIDLPANTNQAFAIIRGVVALTPTFLKTQLDSFVAQAVKRRARGGAMRNVSLGDLRDLSVVIPPLAEQKRIVAKVDELMRLIDELEEKQAKKRQAQARLRTAAHDALAKASGPEEVAAAWERVKGNFETLFERVEDIGRVRKVVLDLAVRGALVEQISEEGSSRALTARLKTERPPVEEGEQPFTIPNSWSWIRLGDCGRFLGGGTPSKSNYLFWTGPIPWVSPKDMKRPYIADSADHISEIALRTSAVKLIPPRSLLFVVRGMILAHSFPSALTTKEVTINQDMKALVFAVSELDEFILRVCWASRDRVLALIERSSHGTCRLDYEAVANLPIPLPPLAEQKRIVAKVDALMALCDDLEAKLKAKEAAAAKLAEAVVKSIIG